MAEQEQSSIMSEVQEARKETKAERNTIENILKSSDDAMKAKKEELFFAELNKSLEGKTDKDGKQISITSYDQLTVAQRRELENFKVPDDEMKKMFEETRNEIKDLTTQRSDALDSLGDKIEQLYKEAEQNISRITEELKNPELSEDEKKSLEDELARWNKISDEIGPEKGSESPVRKTLAQAMDNHDQARMNGVEGMALIYPKELVYNDPEVKGKIVPAKKRDEFNKQVQGEQDKDEQEKADNKEQEKAPQAGKIDPAAAAKLAQQMAGQQAATAQAPNIVAEDAKKEPTFIDALGWDNNNNLTYSKARDVMNVFLGKKPSPLGGMMLTDMQKLRMLRDPEVVKALQSSIMKMNDRSGKLGFLKGIAANGMNKKLQKLITQTLPELSVKEMESVSKEDKELMQKEIGDKIGLDVTKNINEQLNNIKDPKKITQIELAMQDQFKAYEDKYAEVENLYRTGNITQEQYDTQRKAIESRASIFEKVVEQPYSLTRFNNIVTKAMDCKTSEKYTLSPASVLEDKGNSFAESLGKQTNDPLIAEKNKENREMTQKEVEKQIEESHVK